MFALFMQNQGGMVWLSNHKTLEDAKEAMDEVYDGDFAMILPVVAFRDIDGERTE